MLIKKKKKHRHHHVYLHGSFRSAVPECCVNYTVLVEQTKAENFRLNIRNTLHNTIQNYHHHHHWFKMQLGLNTLEMLEINNMNMWNILMWIYCITTLCKIVKQLYEHIKVSSAMAIGFPGWQMQHWPAHWNVVRCHIHPFNTLKHPSYE